MEHIRSNPATTPYQQQQQQQQKMSKNSAVLGENAIVATIVFVH